jgi:hypothetical protein
MFQGRPGLGLSSKAKAGEVVMGMRQLRVSLAFGALVSCSVKFMRVFRGHIAVSWGLRPQHVTSERYHFTILLHLIVSLPAVIIRLFCYTGHSSPPITSRSCLTQKVRNYALFYHLSLPLLSAILPSCQRDHHAFFFPVCLCCAYRSQYLEHRSRSDKYRR